MDKNKKEISKVKWRDGVIVLFEGYDSHTGEGGDEVFDSEISLLQKGIVLGSRVVGCDYELKENDFVNGLYEEGVDEDGGYSVYEYTKATLVEPEWLATSLAQAEQKMLKGVVGKIKYILDFAELDKEMAEDPEDPKVRINYFRARLDDLLSSREINNKE